MYKIWSIQLTRFLRLATPSESLVDHFLTRQADQARYTRYQAIAKEIAELEVEMQGTDCEKVVKEHIRALNEVSWARWMSDWSRSRAKQPLRCQ